MPLPQKTGAFASQVLSFLMLCLAWTLVFSDNNHGCPESFEGRCHCGKFPFPLPSLSSPNPPLKYVVNCTNTHFTNADMLVDIPLQIEVLVFTGNNVAKLPKNVFGIDNLESFEYIDMSNNHISYIQGQSFHQVKSVETLILNYNDISILEHQNRPRIFSNFDNLRNLHLTDAFTDQVNASAYYLLNLEGIFIESDLDILEKLHMDQNEIWSFGKNKSTFCPLKSLKQIYLADNKLTDLDFRIECLPYLSLIDLRYNMITRLSNEAMQSVTNHKNKVNLALTDNPFECDCRSRSFLDWVKDKHLILRQVEDYRCLDGYPDENIDMQLIAVESALCPATTGPPVSSKERGEMGGYSSTTVGVLSFLLVLMTCVTLWSVCSQRRSLRHLTVPFSNRLSMKVGYAGLEHEEMAHEVNV